ncbi:MAG: SgcJ/EcaC family oxidoreductase [Pseudomonadota bacterium]
MKLAIIIAVVCVTWAGSAIAQKADRYAKEKAAVRSEAESFVQAFNKGDAESLSSHWAEDAEYTLPSGEVLKGRDKIEQGFKKFFSENQGIQIQLAISEIRFPKHNEAIEQGSAVVSRPGEKPKELTYEVTHVKRKGAWKIAHVEETESAQSNYEHLKELEWLIGEWVDDSEDVDVETLAQWTKNKNFITLSFRVVFEGRPALEGTEVIGWDPSVKSIKSWVFDSLGGFGQGVWSREGSRWTVKTADVLITGEKTSAINIYTALDENTFTFNSISRETNGEPQPNIEEIRVVRKQTSQ